MSQALLAEAQERYQAIRAIYEKSSYHRTYPLNRFWGDENMKIMLRAIFESADAAGAVQAVQETLLFSLNSTGPIKERAVEWLLDAQKRQGLDIFALDPSVQESEFSNPANNIIRDGRRLTPDFLRMVSTVREIQRHCPQRTGRYRVLELGAGCGHLARALRLFIPGYTHVILDIPETLTFCYMFLKLNFPQARTLYASRAEDLEEARLDDFDYVFVPSVFAEALRGQSFDLFVNTLSMGEMHNTVIRYWMNFIQHTVRVKHLFTLNRFLNTILVQGQHQWRLSENECSVHYDAGWDVLDWQVQPYYMRCPFIYTLSARHVQIIARRRAPEPAGIRRRDSERLLAAVLDEDWARLESMSPVMTCRDSDPVPDLEMTGSLFKLWESIRMELNPRNVAAMLKFLETLLHRHGVEFEEAFYYESLFERLCPGGDPALERMRDTIRSKRRYRRSAFLLPPSYFPSILGDTNSPLLIEEHGEFNIVLFRGYYYALAKNLGPLDLAAIAPGALADLELSRRCFVADSVDDLKSLIDQESVLARGRSAS